MNNKPIFTKEFEKRIKHNNKIYRLTSLYDKNYFGFDHDFMSISNRRNNNSKFGFDNDIKNKFILNNIEPTLEDIYFNDIIV